MSDCRRVLPCELCGISADQSGEEAPELIFSPLSERSDLPHLLSGEHPVTLIFPVISSFRVR